jgi:hypothetical protein
VTTEDVIRPIVTSTYGKGGMVDALVTHLASVIDGRKWDSRGREFRVMVTCWDWFSGGTTADSVAQKIEAALNDQEPWS